LGQGRENVKEFLKQHPDIAAEIEQSIRASITNISAPAADDALEEPEDI
ncbi:MAG TPA: DNA recombination/repair protein RecA, partial [Desulfitobacterium dehalogenans]|nr:DNA recombination/repair protein RecA [Desulfitobacterium dehalogenans]